MFGWLKSLLNGNRAVPVDKDPRHALGVQGERVAEQYLRRRGMKTIARRYSTPVGELDLVMRDGKTIVFVEVKTLRSRVHKDPQDAIGTRKIERLTRAAQWLIHQRRWHERPCRFDVVAVTLPEDAPPQIEHFEAPFSERPRNRR